MAAITGLGVALLEKVLKEQVGDLLSMHSFESRQIMIDGVAFRITRGLPDTHSFCGCGKFFRESGMFYIDGGDEASCRDCFRKSLNEEAKTNPQIWEIWDPKEWKNE